MNEKMNENELMGIIEYLERYWSKMQNFAFYIETAIRLTLSTLGILSIVRLASGADHWIWISIAITSIIISHIILPALKIDGLHTKVSYIHKQWRDLEHDIKHAPNAESKEFHTMKFKEMYSEDYGIPVFNKIANSVIDDMEAYYNK